MEQYKEDYLKIPEKGNDLPSFNKDIDFGLDCVKFDFSGERRKALWPAADLNKGFDKENGPEAKV